jgi:hypothetical protein
MNRIPVAIGPVVLGLGLMASACFGGEKSIPGKEALFVTNDCVPVAAVARDHYKFTATDPALRLKLNGEDLPWKPNCDWRGMGLNVVDASAPNAADAGGEVSFNRPLYIEGAAIVRTTLNRGPQQGERLVCRVNRDESDKWVVDTCGPDPRFYQPRAALPSPADVSPEGRIGLPADGAPPTARDATTLGADPGAPRP